MELTITIPVWLVWILGGIVGICAIGLAVIGVLFLWQWKDGFGF